MCDDLKFFRWCYDVVLMISSAMDLEGFKGELSICTVGCPDCDTGHKCNRGSNCGKKCVSLPREVETVLAVNIGGKPALGFSQLFNFHQNGPGEGCQSCEWSWQDQGKWHSTMRDIITPAKLVTHLQSEADSGKMVIIYGYDENGNKLMREECNQCIEGLRLPTIYAYPTPDSAAPKVARITGIFKDETCGTVRIATSDSDGISGINLAVLEPDERIPQYRRITLNRACDWLHIAYSRVSPTFKSRFDHIPIRSRLAFLLGMSARKNYAALQLAEAHAFEADAMRHELLAQQKMEAPLYFPLQVIDRAGSLRDKNDYDIV